MPFKIKELLDFVSKVLNYEKGIKYLKENFNYPNYESDLKKLNNIKIDLIKRLGMDHKDYVIEGCKDLINARIEKFL